MIIAIPIIYMLLAAMLLWVCIGCKGWWWLKISLISFSTTFCLSLTFSLQSLFGWPSPDDLPEKFQLQWIIIKEPTTLQAKDGAIYLWVKTLTPVKEPWWMLYQSNQSEPRAYITDYTRKRHEQAAAALGMLKKGQGVIGYGGKGSGKGRGGKGKGQGGRPGFGKIGKFLGKFFGNPGEAFRGHDKFLFYEMPPPKLPEK